MARKSQPVKKPTAKQTAAQKRQTQNRREIWALVCIFLAIFSIICCFNTTAFLIKPFASLIAGLFGQAGRYILPLALIATVVILFTSRGKPVRLRIVSVFTLILTVSAVYHLIQGEALAWEWKVVPALFKGGIAGTTGGLLGGLLAMLLKTGITVVGAYIVLILVMLVQIITIMNMTVNSIITAIKNRPRLQEPDEEPEPEQDTAERIVNHMANRHIARVEKRRAAEFDLPVDDPPLEKAEKRKKKSRVPSPDEYLEKQQEERPAARPVSVTCDDVPEEPLHAAEHPVTVVPEAALPKEPVPEPAFEPVPVQELPEEPEDRPEPAAEQEPAAPWDEAPAPQYDEPAVRPAPAKQEDAEELVIPQPEQSGQAEYVFPPVSLLTPRREGSVDATSEMRENSQRLADTLKSFGIEPHIVDVIRGPSVTRYELELDRGVKLSKITNLADDIALALGAAGVRISAIPDKVSVVGIEVPNKIVNTVYAREVIDSPAFRSSKSKISFAVGKDISGNCIVGDIAKLPHMLIAGTTGSGKSVCMNTLIVSLLYKAKPDEVRLIMVDPKMVELGVYNGIPQLLIPVVTDPKKAAGALQWTVTEMMRRYRLMSEEGVRDLDSYNKAIAGDPERQKLPQIVVVIDELADLMLVAAKEVEESICRIAQMGRASGIHLVIATQRPSADVITGLMKANIPSRIAFAVSSAMESRIILDTPGAEKLVGKGDMLFAPLGQGKPKRVQGCFISDEEVQAVVNAVKAQSQSDYSAEVMEQIERRAEQSGKPDSGAAAQDTGEGDELLPAAVDVILETGQASVSFLQRRLKLGYARAARIVDEMEERGIIGPYEGAKPRQLLITREQWEQMQNGTYAPPAPPVEDELP